MCTRKIYHGGDERRHDKVVKTAPRSCLGIVVRDRLRERAEHRAFLEEENLTEPQQVWHTKAWHSDKEECWAMYEG